MVKRKCGMAYTQASLIFSVVILASCATRSIPKSISSPTIAHPSATSSPDVDNSSALYLVAQNKGLSNLQLFYLPLPCIFASEGCQSIETIPDFPNDFSPISSNILDWSPDGRYALLLNTFTPELILFDSRNQKFQTLVTDVLTISDQFAWTPDSQSAAMAVQSSDPYSSSIVTISLNGEMHTLPIKLDGLLQPLQWTSMNELLLLRHRYQGSGLKRDVIGFDIYRFDTNSTETQELLSVDSTYYIPVLSPDGLKAALSSLNGDVSIYDMQLQMKVQLGNLGSVIDWSPDGEWIAIQNHNALFVVGSDGKGAHQLLELQQYDEVYWLPDSRHLLLRRNVYQNRTDKSILLVVPIENTKVQEVNIPGVDLLIQGISFGPVLKKP